MWIGTWWNKIQAILVTSWPWWMSSIQGYLLGCIWIGGGGGQCYFTFADLLTPSFEFTITTGMYNLCLLLDVYFCEMPRGYSNYICAIQAPHYYHLFVLHPGNSDSKIYFKLGLSSICNYVEDMKKTCRCWHKNISRHVSTCLFLSNGTLNTWKTTK